MCSKCKKTALNVPTDLLEYFKMYLLNQILLFLGM